jgi:cytochrome c5
MEFRTRRCREGDHPADGKFAIKLEPERHQAYRFLPSNPNARPAAAIICRLWVVAAQAGLKAGHQANAPGVSKASTISYPSDEKLRTTMSEEAFIKTPRQLIWAVALAFLVPIFVIVLLINYVGVGEKPAAGSDGLSEAAVAERIAPVAKLEFGSGGPSAAALAVASAVPAPVAVAQKFDGPGLYKTYCSACHAAGIAGAPKYGDKAAWAPRIAKGVDALVQSVVNGKNAMPPKGGVAAATPADLKLAVEYMTAAAK